MGDGKRVGADFTYKIQDHNDPINNPVGIASALKLAKDFTKEQKFAVVLGDNFFENTFENEVNIFKESNLLGHLFLKDVGNDITRFGCAYTENNKISKIIEKPKILESTLAVTGLYFYTPDVYNVAKECKVSDRGELEISHINDYYAKMLVLGFSTMSGFWSDMGIPSSMIKTTEWINSNNYTISFGL
jgi:glucose-1-phosphate thymidylyltransferase